MKQLIINVQVRISVLHRRTIGDDGHWATLLVAAKREGRGHDPRSEEREFREGNGEGERAHAAV